MNWVSNALARTKCKLFGHDWLMEYWRHNVRCVRCGIDEFETGEDE